MTNKIMVTKWRPMGDDDASIQVFRTEPHPSGDGDWPAVFDLVVEAPIGAGAITRRLSPNSMRKLAVAIFEAVGDE